MTSKRSPEAKQYRRFYMSKAWRKCRRDHLAKHPLCDVCAKLGIHTPAVAVDHIEPHRGDRRLFWDPTNRQSCCASCHASHEQRRDNQGYSSIVGEDGWPVDPDHPIHGKA